MRIESRALSISWIPTESVQGALRRGFDLGVAHYDLPPPHVVDGPAQVYWLRDEDAFRFANVLSAWIEVDDGNIVDFGRSNDSGLVIGSTTVRIAPVAATFRAVSLPDLQPEPTVSGSSVQFVQTVGGRTGVPLPRPVRHAPFMQWQAPIVWTTLGLTIHADGRSDVDLLGASAFPRHWVYDSGGALSLKSSVTDQDSWVAHSFGDRTPWGDQDSAALVTAGESAAERQLSRDVLRAGQRPQVRRLPAGEVVTRQGDPGHELYLVMDGVLGVDVDGQRVGELGPGAIVGERALLEGGRRTSTLVALTPIRLIVVDADAVDLDHLKEVAQQHRREAD